VRKPLFKFMKIQFRPVAVLEDYIANAFRLKKKGRKLLGVGFALFGVLSGVLILQLATLLVCRSNLQLWWRAMIPWIPIFVWASWRFLIRYLHPEAFVCEHCGRLKCLKARSPKYFGKTKVCLECEKREVGFNERIGAMNRQLDIISEGLRLVTNFPNEPRK